MDALERIAAALERLSPPPPAPADLLAHPAYVWRDGAYQPIASAALPMDRLIGLERQRDALVGNLKRLAQGHAAHDVLLWGARGSGKSALAKAAVAAVQRAHPALALVVASALADLPALFAAWTPGRPAAVFVDDVGVDAVADARALRSLLEGGAVPRPEGMRLLVTANRRHLLPRSHGGEHEDAINPRDAADDQLALADRFGLSLGFHVLDQDGYLAIVASYAAVHGLAWEPAEALQWAQRRGSRSGRVAWQFVVEIAGRAGRGVGSGGELQPPDSISPGDGGREQDG